jgi:hypothetical protein
MWEFRPSMTGPLDRSAGPSGEAAPRKVEAHEQILWRPAWENGLAMPSGRPFHQPVEQPEFNRDGNEIPGPQMDARLAGSRQGALRGMADKESAMMCVAALEVVDVLVKH